VAETRADPVLRTLGLGLWVNGLVFGLIALLWKIEADDKNVYYLLVQEDGLLEWGTVVLLLPAIWLCGKGMRGYRASFDRVPWFFAGLLTFCVFFAGEEISWGQRLMAYQPPEYFLEHNSQQELNVHNLFKKVLRTKYLLMMILGVWGVLLPLVNAGMSAMKSLLTRFAGLDPGFPVMKDALRWTGFLVPSALLAPSFAATGLLLREYPWKYTGEVAECLFALGLFLAVALMVEDLPKGVPKPRLPLAARLAGTVGACAAIAWLTPTVLGVVLHGSDDERTQMVEREIEALIEDWHTHTEAAGKAPSRCGTHIRMYTWIRKHDYDTFWQEAFAALDIDGTRREYFLDPWNSPYWIRHVCTKKSGRTKRIVIYSFGPDSHRESTKKELGGDDIGGEFLPR
jgi:hypothetical protein